MATSQNKSLPMAVTIPLGLALAVGGFYLSAKTDIFAGIIEASQGFLGMPIDPGKSLAAIGVLIALFPIIKEFYFKTLDNAINERNSNLERTFTEAEQLRSEMNTLKSDYEKRITATEAEARSQIQNQIQEVQGMKAQMMADAAKKADALIKKAQEDIAAERESIVNELRIQVVDLSLAAASKVVNENMDNERNRRLVQEFVTASEASKN